MSNRLKNIIVSIIAIIVVVALAFAVYAYVHRNSKNKAAQSVVQPQQSSSKWVDIKSPSTSNSLTSALATGVIGLPRPLDATIVFNRDYYDTSVKPAAYHHEFEYTQPNPTSGSTIQQTFLSSIKAAGWQNIQSSNSTITANITLPHDNNYSLTATFTSKDSKNTIIDVQYEDKK
jgi:heme/copper-type cytochrome/quinol oxidase subunit 2